MLAKVFQSGNSQAVRLPKALRFDVNEVEITKEGDNLIIKPVKPNLTDAFYALSELHDAFKDFERDDMPPVERESFDD
ncbi:MAG: AbrB/MazE/SpoVT family DNA-binding domain-containing protein [Gammaproteobacteria bacterium]|uniref:SpoVT-AbrB domain-containing protein n=1 Tax=hydrothermal vent metagenome TaxID=652676 RepID=A0A1W1E2L2_9ZZZZ|nr:AbrB/MazE/SpoVT family DNA-binding domain-containing protein [Gammaproteobacteria bacterium]